MKSAPARARKGPEEARESIRAWLREHSKSVSWLADQLGTSQPNVSRWLTSSRPEEPYREALFILTGTPAEWWRTTDEWKAIDRVTRSVSA